PLMLRAFRASAQQKTQTWLILKVNYERGPAFCSKLNQFIHVFQLMTLPQRANVDSGNRAAHARLNVASPPRVCTTYRTMSAILGRLFWRVLVAFGVGWPRRRLRYTGLAAMLAALILRTFEIVFLRHCSRPLQFSETLKEQCSEHL